jgi:hypothetical protein
MITQEMLTATLAEREREIVQLASARKAERAPRPPTRSRQEGWSWRVEPGMGEAFRSLRGWLLSRAGGGRIDYLPSAR